MSKKIFTKMKGKKMKRLLKLALLCLVSFNLLNAADKIIVGTDTSFVPFEFKKNNSYVGFDIDMLKEISKDLKIDYELRPMDFQELFLLYKLVKLIWHLPVSQ